MVYILKKSIISSPNLGIISIFLYYSEGNRIYRELFSSVSDDDEIKIIKKNVEDRISTCNTQDFEKINSSCVKRAVKKLKPSKNDLVYIISSNCFKNSAVDLFIHLAKIIRYFIYHGHVSKFLLISYLIPLVMDKFSDKTLY